MRIGYSMKRYKLAQHSRTTWDDTLQTKHVTVVRVSLQCRTNYQPQLTIHKNINCFQRKGYSTYIVHSKQYPE